MSNTCMPNTLLIGADLSGAPGSLESHLDQWSQFLARRCRMLIDWLHTPCQASPQIPVLAWPIVLGLVVVAQFLYLSGA